MTGELAGAAEQPEVPAGIDTSRPVQARIYNYWLGGKDNFAVDREAAERALAIMPDCRLPAAEGFRRVDFLGLDHVNDPAVRPDRHSVVRADVLARQLVDVIPGPLTGDR